MQGAQLDAAAGPNDEFEPRAGLGASSAGLGGGGLGSGKASGMFAGQCVECQNVSGMSC